MTRDIKQALAPEAFTVTVSGLNAIGATFPRTTRSTTRRCH